MKLNIKKYIIEYLLLFFIYGFIYFIIECIWKLKLSDYRMFLLGGIIAICVGLQNNLFSFDIDLLYQSINGAILITLCEAILGYQWNTIEGLNLWDYTNTGIYGVDGNVSLAFTIFAWIPLSCLCILIDDYIWYKILHNGEKPYYSIFDYPIILYK